MPKALKCRVRRCVYTPTSREDLNAHIDSVHRTEQGTLKCILCPTYSTVQMSNLNSHIEARHNPDRERFQCTVEGCTSTQASQRHLDDHIEKQHKGGGYINCPIDDCTFKAQYKNVIDLHVASLHSDDRPFVCSFDGCMFSAKRKDTLETHTRRHTGIRPYLCSDCPRQFRFRQSLLYHMQVHNPTKPWLPCTMCSFRTQRPSKLNEHVNHKHLQIKPLKCPYEGCSISFPTSRRSNLRNHINAVHEKTQLYTCSVTQCGFATYHADILSKHERFNHTQSGSRVRCGKEYQFIHSLTETLAGRCTVHQPYALNKELLRHHCNRKFIHVDAGFFFEERELLVLVECDEQQHKDETVYKVNDELARMQDATHAIRTSGNEAHVLWVRFNPDTYIVVSADGEERRFNDDMADRIKTVVEFIEDFVPSDNDSDQDMSIVYMYYDCIMVNGAPVARVTRHEEYFDELKSCVMTTF